MKKSAALIAVAGLAAVATAQPQVNILVNGGSSVTFADLTSVTPVTVSMQLDTNGAFADFSSWAAFIGTFDISHSGAGNVGDIGVPAELNTDEAKNPAAPLNGFSTDTDWTGRRPAAWGSTLGVPPAGNATAGSWRFPGLTSGYQVDDNGGGNFSLSDGGAPINSGQQPAALGNSAHNPDDPIEVFRFVMTPSVIGTYTIDVMLNDLAYFLAGNNASISGLQSTAQINSARITVPVPTPATAALLGMGGLVAVRRRR